MSIDLLCLPVHINTCLNLHTNNNTTMAFTLPELPYATNALETYIDTQTMEIHHGKHHNAYVTNLNAAIAGTDAEHMSIEDICKNISKFSPAIRNNGGGHFNHSLFWTVMI